MSDLDLLVDRAKSAGALRVYKAGEVPPKPAGAYMVLGLDTGTKSSTRADGRSPNRRYRLTVQMFSTSDDGLRDMARLADEAFDEVTLAEFEGAPFCHRELVAPLPPSRDPDGEVLLYVLHTYRY